MKKQYVTPQTKSLEMNLDSALLAGSGNSITISDEVFDASKDTQLARPRSGSVWGEDE